jgi:hypothetical protein
MVRAAAIARFAAVQVQRPLTIIVHGPCTFFRPAPSLRYNLSYEAAVTQSVLGHTIGGPFRRDD